MFFWIVVIVGGLMALPLIMRLLGYPRPTGIFYKGLVAYNTCDYKTARMEFSWLAGQGDADSMFYLGLMYENGYDYPQNYQKALEWYSRAAENGSEEAQAKMRLLTNNKK